MSMFWKPTPYGPRERETHWINFCVKNHDLFCGCDTPADHLLYALTERSGKLQTSKQALENATKCLTTQDGGETATGGEDALDLLDGELERLFENDTEDDITTG